MLRTILRLLLAAGLLAGLSSSSGARQTSGAAFTSTQKEGRRIFQQRCAVCHTPPTLVSKRYGPALYKEIVEDNEDNIREVILEGREGLMPGFKSGLSRAEIDSIIEYLKTVNRPARPKSNAGTKDGMTGSPGE